MKKTKRATKTKRRFRGKHGDVRPSQAIDWLGNPRNDVDAAWIAEAEKKRDALQKEWDNWSRNAPVADRIVFSAWIPSIESGHRQEIEHVAMCLVEQQLKNGSASNSALRYLTSLALKKCVERGFPPPQPLLEVAAVLLAPKVPKYKRELPEERQRVIEYILSRESLPGRRAMGAATNVNDATIRKWLGDAHFVQEVNERAGRKVLPEPGYP